MIKYQAFYNGLEVRLFLKRRALDYALQCLYNVNMIEY